MRKLTVAFTAGVTLGAVGAMCWDYGKAVVSACARVAEDYSREMGHARTFNQP